jgi:hypothetical protein
LGCTGDTLLLELALVHTHPEETVESPRGTPRVSNNPVRSGTSHSPTDDFDGVTTESVTSSVDVDTGVIRHEVGVDEETSLDWAVGVDLLLDSIDVSEGAVSFGVVFLPGTRSGARAVARTLRTRTRGVWVASVSDDTSLVEIVPSFVEVTTLATEVGAITRDHILWGEDNVVTTFDAGSVREDLRGGESPAGTASGLISDGVDARWPLVDGVEAGWESDEISDGFSLLGWHWWEWSEDGTEVESLDLSLSKSGELVGGSDPGVLHRVDLVDLLLSTDVGTVREGDEGDEK